MAIYRIQNITILCAYLNKGYSYSFFLFYGFIYTRKGPEQHKIISPLHIYSAHARPKKAPPYIILPIWSLTKLKGGGGGWFFRFCSGWLE
jgi:hypothetical protein